MNRRQRRDRDPREDFVFPGLYGGHWNPLARWRGHTELWVIGVATLFLVLIMALGFLAWLIQHGDVLFAAAGFLVLLGLSYVVARRMRRRP